MRVFVTGASGFVGSFLVEHLLAGGHDVHVLVHHGSCTAGVVSHRGDVLQTESLQNAFGTACPDAVFHLAGEARSHTSVENPRSTLSINFIGTVNLLEAVRTKIPKARVLVVTSSEIYGARDSIDNPLGENSQFRPRQPYAVSKAGVHYLARYYADVPGLHVVEARPFNHVGPRQREGFVVPDFARQITEMMLGRHEPVMRVGDLDTIRDVTDVRDVVRAYALLIEQGDSGQEYHVCSGRGIRIGDVLQKLISLSEREIKIVVDPSRLRPSQVPVIVGSYEKLRARCGWHPQIPLEKTLRDTLEYWRQILSPA